MKIKSLKDIDFNQIYKAFSTAFKDYEVQLSAEQLKAMLHRRGFVAELSFGAFVGKELVSFTLNGIGTFEGVKTAYDTGTGTLEEYRGKGLAKQIFRYAIPYLTRAGVKRYLLEVLQNNENAVRVYNGLGFITTRNFNYFQYDQANLKIEDTLKRFFTIEEISLDDCKNCNTFLDFHPSWQNSFESIGRSKGIFTMLAARHNEQVIGYIIFEDQSGDITQIAVDPMYRRRGIGTALLKEALKHNKGTTFKLINSDIECNAITLFFKSKGIEVLGKQFEMVKELSL